MSGEPHVVDSIEDTGEPSVRVTGELAVVDNTEEDTGEPSVRVDIEDMLRRLANGTRYDPSNHKISLVPDFLREVNKAAYDPTIVAIGPIHHGDNHIKDMEKHKVWYLEQLLRKRNENNIDKYLEELGKHEPLLRNFYSRSIQLPEKNEFLKMLIVDGIFVIELARKCLTRNNINENDFVFQYSEVHYNEVLIQIRRDLLMLENQLPFIVVKTLFDMTKVEGLSGHNEMSLHRLLLTFIHRIVPGQPEAGSIKEDYGEEQNHLLGLVHRAFFTRTTDDQSQNHQNNRDFMFQDINSTSELQESGIRFKKAETTMLMNVTFKGKVLEIPKLDVGDVTESIFRNLIAYEQIRGDDRPRFVTEYCFLMQFLVNSTKDVEIFRRAGIVINWLGDDETVRLFFNKLTKNVAASQDFYYSNMIRNVNDYCLRHKWWADLRRNYFSSPWAYISVMAATILLLMTAGQTVYTVLDYKNGKTK